MTDPTREQRQIQSLIKSLQQQAASHAVAQADLQGRIDELTRIYAETAEELKQLREQVEGADKPVNGKKRGATPRTSQPAGSKD